jgi:hypothetical protein
VLTLLPLAALVVLWLLLGNLVPRWGWRRAALRAAVAAGVWLVLATEALSLLNAITPAGLAAVWALALLAAAGALGIHAKKAGKLLLPVVRIPSNWLDRLLLVGVLAVLAVTALIARLAPPNTWDSLNYHMPRVAHWAQDRSLRPFATGIEIQNSMNPGAEMIVLHLYVLSGGDRWVNFAEWLAMGLSLIGVTLVARQLGGKPPAGLVAALVAVTLPMGIIQASSTMTDYVTAFWAVCAASEILTLVSGEERPSAVVPWLASAAGMAVLAKATAVPFLLPLGLWAAIALWRRAGARQAALLAALGACGILILNAGYLARMIAVYGSPVAGERVTTHSNELRDPRVLVSNTLRNAGLEAGTPWPEVNRVIERAILKVHQWIRLDVNDPRTTTIGEFSIQTPSQAEDRAGNPAQAWLYVFVGALILVRRREIGGRALIYAGALAAGFLLFGYLFKWQVFGVRLHLPFFVLFAPVAGVGLTRALPAAFGRIVALALVLLSIPWLVGIEERPLLRDLEGSHMPSVLYETRRNLYLGGAGTPGLVEITDQTREAGCREVGIALAGGAAEYPWWVFLGAPDQGLRIEWIVSGTPSERFEDPSFSPCAIVCDTSCPAEWARVRGLPLVFEDQGYRLFLRPPVDPGGASS